MKHEEAPEMAFIPRPFCANGERDVFNTSADNNVNFNTGFPSIYSAQDGKFVRRTEMNGLGYISTANQFFRACGGIYTFDQKLANAIGGYPKYAVLEYLEGLNYSKVISLKDDNFVDFTSGPIIDIAGGNRCTQGSVDGVNWAFLGEGSIPDYDTLFTLGTRYSSGESKTATFRQSAYFPVASFLAPRSGLLTFKGAINFIPSTGIEKDWNTAAIVIYQRDSKEELEEISAFQRGGTCIFKAGIATLSGYATAQTKAIYANKWYSVWLGLMEATLEFDASNPYTGYIA